MTTLVCNFIDIIGEPIDGVASLSTGEVRPDYTDRSVKVPHPVSETVVEGLATFDNVRPGKAVLTVHWDGRFATFRFTVPDAESITLVDAVAGEGLEQSELDEFRAGIAAEFSNTRNVVIEAAASANRDAIAAQEAATAAADSAEEASEAVSTAAAGAVAEVKESVAADKALIEGYKNEAAASVTQVIGIVSDASAATVAAVQEELDEEIARSEAAAAKAEQHEAGAAAAAANEVNKLKGAAPEAFDTLEEIAAELAANETDRSALANAIAAKADRVHTHTAEDVDGLEEVLANAGGPPVIVSTTPPEDTDAIWVNPDEVPPTGGGTAEQDTGWRNIAGVVKLWPTNTWDATKDTLWIRRVGSTVHLMHNRSTDITNTSWGVGDNIPAGFRPAVDTGLIVHGRDNNTGGYLLRTSGMTVWTGPDISAAYFMAPMQSWPTADPWPTTLPGTAVEGV